MATTFPKKVSKKAKAEPMADDAPIQFGVPSEAATPSDVERAAIPVETVAVDMTNDVIDMPELADAFDEMSDPVVEVVAAPPTDLPAATMTAAAIAPVGLDIPPIDVSAIEAASPIDTQTTPQPTEAKKGFPMDDMTKTAMNDTINNATTTATNTMTGAADTMKNAASDMQAHGTAMFGDMNTRAKSAMERGTKAVEELVEFQKGNLEAMMTSGRVAANGAQEIAKYSAEYGRSTIEKANATARQFATIKSPTEFFQLQGEIAKQTLDALVAEGAKFTESYMKLVGEVAQPLSNRVAVAVDKVKTTVGNQS